MNSPSATPRSRSKSIVGFLLGFILALGVINIRDISRDYTIVRRDYVPHLTWIHWSESVPTSDMKLWQDEIASKYPDAVVVCCHGNDDKGVWSFHPDTVIAGFRVPLPPIPVEAGVAKLKREYPGRTIVLLTCNPGHHRLTIPGVVYSLNNVWIEPDKHAAQHDDDDATGNIHEFVQS
jgi:hypothetical protein